ncbi:MAG: AzlD domain-containing protein [Hyphomicrobiaceae bacterium]
MSDLSAVIQNGWMGYALILVAGVAMTEPWRWAGVWLSRDLDIDSEVFRWVRAVSTALVSGLVARLVIFPIGQLETVPLGVRLAAFGGGVLIYLFVTRNLALGVVGGTTILLAGAMVFGV